MVVGFLATAPVAVRWWLDQYRQRQPRLNDSANDVIEYFNTLIRIKKQVTDKMKIYVEKVLDEVVYFSTDYGKAKGIWKGNNRPFNKV